MIQPNKDGTSTQRFSHVDLLESLAIFLVLVYHSTLYDWDILNRSSAVIWVNYFLRSIIPSSISIFFFVNGYLLFNRPFDLKKHLKRTGRYIFLIIIWACISLPVYLLIAHKPITLNNLIWPILNLSTEYGMNVYWYLGALVCVYFFFPVLKTAFDANRKTVVVFAVICAFFTLGVNLLEAIVILLNRVAHRGLETLQYPFFTMFNPFRGIHGYTFVSFCSGGLIYSYEDRILQIPAKKRNFIAVLGVLISCTGLFGLGVFYSNALHEGVWELVWGGLGTVFSFANTIFLYLLSLNYRTNGKLIRVISANTLGIYFLHTGFNRIASPFLKTIPAFCNFPVTVIYAALVLTVCLCISLLIKRIPVLQELL